MSSKPNNPLAAFAPRNKMSSKPNNPLAAFAPRKLRSAHPIKDTSSITSSTPKKSLPSNNDNNNGSDEQHFEIPVDRVVIKDKSLKKLVHRNTASTSKSRSSASSDVNLNTTLGLSSAAMSEKDSTTAIEQHKRKNIMNCKDDIVKLPRLNDRDAETLNKALSYSKRAYEEALASKESSIRTENLINEFIKEQSRGNENSKYQKKHLWCTQTMTNACFELFLVDKDPNEKTMCSFIHNSLAKAHPEEVSKIENNDGWEKYWNEVLHSQARSEFRMKRANYVRNIKSAISNTFGKVFLGEIPGQKATMDEISNWKKSTNVVWAKNNLWNKIKDSNTDDDTYINRILNEVFKVEHFTSNNCLFVLAVVDIIFDASTPITTLTGEVIIKRMNKLSDERDEKESNQGDEEVDE